MDRFALKSSSSEDFLISWVIVMLGQLSLFSLFSYPFYVKPLIEVSLDQKKKKKSALQYGTHTCWGLSSVYYTEPNVVQKTSHIFLLSEKCVLFFYFLIYREEMELWKELTYF